MKTQDIAKKLVVLANRLARFEHWDAPEYVQRIITFTENILPECKEDIEVQLQKLENAYEGEDFGALEKQVMDVVVRKLDKLVQTATKLRDATASNYPH